MECRWTVIAVLLLSLNGAFAVQGNTKPSQKTQDCAKSGDCVCCLNMNGTVEPSESCKQGIDVGGNVQVPQPTFWCCKNRDFPVSERETKREKCVDENGQLMAISLKFPIENSYNLHNVKSCSFSTKGMIYWVTVGETVYDMGGSWDAPCQKPDGNSDQEHSGDDSP